MFHGICELTTQPRGWNQKKKNCSKKQYKYLCGSKLYLVFFIIIKKVTRKTLNRDFYQLKLDTNCNIQCNGVFLIRVRFYIQIRAIHLYLSSVLHKCKSCQE